MKKKNLFSLLAITMCISISGCAANDTSASSNVANEVTSQVEEDTSSENTVEFDLTEYKALVKEYKDSLYSETILICNMAKYERAYWEAIDKISGSNTDFDSLLESSYDWLLENVDTSKEMLTTNYDDISNSYIEIITTEISGPEAEEIEEYVKSLYSSFDLLYKMTTEPSGDIDSFVSDYNDYASSINSDSDILGKLVE